MTERRKSDGPKRREKNRSPQAESDRWDLRGEEVVGSDFGFGNPAWALRVLLGTSQGESRQFCVEAGPMTLTLTALDPEYGLPYGTYARLVFAWICTEVVRTRSPVLHLGRRFSEFMTRHGVPTSHSGGALRVPTRLRDQMNRLFSCGIMPVRVDGAQEACRWSTRNRAAQSVVAIRICADVHDTGPRNAHGATDYYGG